MMDIREDWLLWFTNFFDKKSSSGSGVATLANKFAVSNNNKIKQNIQLAEELHRPIIRNFKKGTVYLGYKDNICGADLADKQLTSKFNKGLIFLVNMLGLFL